MNAPAPIGSVEHYNLLERLEPSGPGELFRARDTKLGRTVTVRLLPAAFAASQAEREQLLLRARSMTSLSHPNITTLFDAGEHDSRVFLVFEYLKGQSLRAEMAGRPMNVRRAIELAIQIADAVAEAHAANLIHGGLSPDTIVITAKGHAKIPAFDLAARVGFEDAGGVSQLRDYGSPEESRGGTPDDRSDIHSVGSVLFEMLTTRRPSHRGAAAPSSSNRHVPKEVDEVVLRAVEPDPDRRYQSAATLAAELRSVAAILDVRGLSADEVEVQNESQGGGIGRILLLALLMLVAIAGMVWWSLG